MKKRFLSVVFITLIAVISGWNFTHNEEDDKTTLSDLALANVDALAQSEGGIVNCWLTEDIWQWCYPWGTGLGCSACFS